MNSNGNFTYPGTATLSPQIERLLNKACSPCYMVELVSRELFDYRSTSPAEIISCRLNNGKIIFLFCKYAGSHTRYSDGHRGGVEYETMIYEKVLDATPLDSAFYYGVCGQPGHEQCLVIQYLQESKLLKDDHDPENFAKAAAWIASLHQRYESNPPAGIKTYDTDYYLIWLHRVEKMMETLKDRYPWLSSVCTFFRENMHVLTESPQTFIHGEYYTKNILVQNKIIYPIDWESAAIGPGEIDLASLIEGWDDKRKNAAVESYIKTRWPDESFSKQVFLKRMLLVKIYLFFRWTGEYDDPEVWKNKTLWFKIFYQLLKEAGYPFPVEVN